MPHSFGILTRAMLLAALLLLALGAPAFAGDHYPPDPLVMSSLTVQPDLCEGYAILWMSHDGGESWHPFVQTAIHGDPTNCKPISHAEPYYTQSSLAWEPDPVAGRGPYVADPKPGAAGPWGETQEASLAERYHASVGALVTTVPTGKHEAESYFVQVTSPARYAQLDFSTGAKPGVYQRHP